MQTFGIKEGYRSLCEGTRKAGDSRVSEAAGILVLKYTGHDIDSDDLPAIAERLSGELHDFGQEHGLDPEAIQYALFANTPVLSTEPPRRPTDRGEL